MDQRTKKKQSTEIYMDFKIYMDPKHEKKQPKNLKKIQNVNHSCVDIKYCFKKKNCPEYKLIRTSQKIYIDSNLYGPKRTKKNHRRSIWIRIHMDPSAWKKNPKNLKNPKCEPWIKTRTKKITILILLLPKFQKFKIKKEMSVRIL